MSEQSRRRGTRWPRRGLLLLALSGASALAAPVEEPPPASAPVAEALLSCSATACVALVPPGLTHVRLCWPPLGVKEAGTWSRLTTRAGEKVTLRAGDGRRCVEVDPGAGPFTATIGGVERTISLMQITDDNAEDVAPDEGSRTWREIPESGRSSKRRPEDISTQAHKHKQAVSIPLPDLVEQLEQGHGRAQLATARAAATSTTAALPERGPKEEVPAPPLPRLEVPYDPSRELERVRKQPVAAADLPRTPPRPRQPPDDESFLDVVAIGDDAGYHCTGVLVAPDALLTAGHCLPATRVAIATALARPLLELPVRASHRHPELDAALVRLPRGLPLVVRARRRADQQRDPSGTMRLVGFGIDEPRTRAGFGIKRRVDAETTSWGCDGVRAKTTGCIPGAELVLAGVGGRDTCLGDSGGPVLELDGEDYRLIALTSRPVARGGAACGRGGIYVRVDALDPWLTPLLEER